MAIDVLSLARAVRGIADARFGVSVELDEVEAFLRPILFEPRHLVAAHDARLITDRELAAGVSARMSDWIVERGGVALPAFSEKGSDEVVDEVQRAMLGELVRE